MKRTFLIVVLTFCLITKSHSQYDPTTVLSPTGISVDAKIFVGTDFDADEIATQNANWTIGYNCIILANSTQYYNCHGYAWHDIEGNMNQADLRWINDRNANQQHNFNVDKYYTGSNPAYIQVQANNRSGLKVSYDPKDHSAVTYSSTYFASKWAYGPLVRHLPEQCPFYQGATIKYYEFNPNITGSESLLCYNNQRTFSMNFNSMPHGTYSWTPGPYVQTVSGANTYSYTIRGIGNGSSSVSFQFSTPSGFSWSSSKNFWAGVPINSSQKVDGQFYTIGKQICPGNHWLDVAFAGYANNATWTVPAGIQYIAGQNTLDFTFPYNLSSISITARATNSCGTSANAAFYLTKKTFGCGGFLSMSLYPNPASETVTVTFKEDGLLEERMDTCVVFESNFNEEFHYPINYSIQIFNNQSQVVASFVRSGQSFNLPLINLNNGSYVIVVSDGTHKYQNVLIVEKR